MAIERESQISIFDTIGYGVVFDVDDAAFRKRIYKECLITVEVVLSLANSGLQLLLQAVLQPDRRNFYGQFRWSAPRLGLKRESEGVDTRNRVYVCANDVYRSFSHFFQYRFSINHEYANGAKPFIYFNFSNGLRTTN